MVGGCSETWCAHRHRHSVLPVSLTWWIVALHHERSLRGQGSGLAHRPRHQSVSQSQKSLFVSNRIVWSLPRSLTRVQVLCHNRQLKMLSRRSIAHTLRISLWKRPRQTAIVIALIVTAKLLPPSKEPVFIVFAHQLSKSLVQSETATRSHRQDSQAKEKDRVKILNLNWHGQLSSNSLFSALECPILTNKASAESWCFRVSQSVAREGKRPLFLGENRPRTHACSPVHEILIAELWSRFSQNLAGCHFGTFSRELAPE